MTPQQVMLIRETFPLVEELAGPLTQLFYGRLFQVAPELRSMFRGSIQVQAVKFAGMLTALADSAADLRKYAGALRAMGHRHEGYGVTAAHYPVVAQSLLWALGIRASLCSNSLKIILLWGKLSVLSMMTRLNEMRLFRV